MSMYIYIIHTHIVVYIYIYIIFIYLLLYLFTYLQKYICATVTGTAKYPEIVLWHVDTAVLRSFANMFCPCGDVLKHLIGQGAHFHQSVDNGQLESCFFLGENQQMGTNDLHIAGNQQAQPMRTMHNLLFEKNNMQCMDVWLHAYVILCICRHAMWLPPAQSLPSIYNVS